MRAPSPRGPLTERLLETLRRPEGPCPELPAAASAAVRRSDDVLRDDDVQSALHTLFELHYTGLDGADEQWERSPHLLATRRVLEDAHLDAVRALVAAPLGALDVPAGPLTRQQVADVLAALVRSDDGPSLARHLDRRGTAENVRELLVHRSLYHLKEADPHSWAIPRLAGAAKVALVEIQSDEYGGGRPEWQHATMFATTLRAAGLSDEPGAYVDAVPAVTLAHLNTMSLFGLQRRLRGAVAGHLAAFEMTSTTPNRRYGNAFRRLGYPADAVAYCDEHVEADAVHEQVASRDLCGRLVEDEPDQLAGVLLGAAACLAMDGLVAGHLLDAWQSGTSSLRAEVPLAA